MIDFKFILIFITGLFFCSLVLLLKKKIYNLYKDYNAPQKIHTGYVPPVGGIIIASLFYIGLIMQNHSSFIPLSAILMSFVIIIAGIIEDFSGTLSAKLRFMFILLASLIYLYNKTTFPSLEIPYLEQLFNEFPYIKLFFYALGLTAITNGVNLIDGVNGLASLTCIAMLVALASVLLLYFNTSDHTYFYELFLLIFCILPFLIFNFPFGKIFLGDAGAYWLGWMIGVFVLEIYSHNSLNTWGAVLIIFYPIFEVFFSFTRKILNKNSPFKPDLNHLHIKLFHLLKGNTDRSIKFNSFVSVCLMPLWYSPSILVIWSHYYSHATFLFIGFLVLIYLYYYLSIPNK